MITKDINLHESGSGGEMAIISNDLLMGETLYMQVYLALFGGNVEAVTRGDEIVSELRSDYWANPLFFSVQPNKQFNSLTEKTIQEIVFNSSGRLRLLDVINQDLSYLSDLLDYEIEVEFTSIYHIRIMTRAR